MAYAITDHDAGLLTTGLMANLDAADYMLTMLADCDPCSTTVRYAYAAIYQAAETFKGWLAAAPQVIARDPDYYVERIEDVLGHRGKREAVGARFGIRTASVEAILGELAATITQLAADESSCKHTASYADVDDDGDRVEYVLLCD